MSFRHRVLYFGFPSLFLLLPAVACLGIDAANRYFRGMATPFTWVALGLALLAGFFWVRKVWLYGALLALSLGFWLHFFLVLFPTTLEPREVVAQFRAWRFNADDGRLQLRGPLRGLASERIAYVSCHFSIRAWRDYLDDQPGLCTALDAEERVVMHFNKEEKDNRPVLEFQWNQYQVPRKSLLGEPLDRYALKIEFKESREGFRPEYRRASLYEVYEREISPGKMRIVESFSRDAHGTLLKFTESPASKLNDPEAYATYDALGILSRIPQIRDKSFSFPARVDLQQEGKKKLPRWISESSGPHSVSSPQSAPFSASN